MTIRKWGAALAAASMLAVSVAAGAFAQPAFTGAKAVKPEYKVIFQLDSAKPSTIKKTLGNVRNVLEDPRLTGKVKVEFLANSMGYKVYLKGNPYKKALLALQARGVILAQCSNTLRELKVNKKTLYPFISFVPSAVGELTIREGNGWAYIHP